MNAKERFLKYVRYETTSDENSPSCPSTPGQTVLLKVLRDELAAMGAVVKQDENGYVTAVIPATKEGLNNLCFISHVDTSPAVSGKDVNPKKVVCDGNDIVLGNGTVISVKETPELLNYKGEELIVTDGKTLLGADDKAGVAEIMTAAEILLKDKTIPHGKILIGFTPDEEIGRGTDLFDVKGFGADFGFTVDGGELGEIEYENFNAASAILTINGTSIHPGSAKNKMKNAIDLFAEFHSMLPENMRPVNTEGYEGFYMADEVSGGVEKLTAKYIIRDHDMEKFGDKKRFFASVVDFLNAKYGEGVFVADIKDSYYNMSEIIRKNYHLIENAEKAMKECGIEPEIIPIRGGTDGARLSFEGLPCPNLSTGGLNFHGRKEFIPSHALGKMTEVILKIIEIYSEKKY